MFQRNEPATLILYGISLYDRSGKMQLPFSTMFVLFVVLRPTVNKGEAFIRLVSAMRCLFRFHRPALAFCGVKA